MVLELKGNPQTERAPWPCELHLTFIHPDLDFGSEALRVEKRVENPSFQGVPPFGGPTPNGASNDGFLGSSLGRNWPSFQQLGGLERDSNY